uniref:Uncharacterized protein n=1 Tax=Lactuca sativa TaxID=4236 RepID=A0A9R1UX82_LACSA|nr:hypothetical protein LSAT_V11C700360140 [Lactuca sativa]
MGLSLRSLFNLNVGKVVSLVNIDNALLFPYISFLKENIISLSFLSADYGSGRWTPKDFSQNLTGSILKVSDPFHFLVILFVNK